MSLEIPWSPTSAEGLLRSIENKVSSTLGRNAHAIRFAITGTHNGLFQVELGVLDQDTELPPPAPIFAFDRRWANNGREFNAVLVIPTGIGAAIGGHAGDAAPVSRLLASACDNLVTHPNVVNASDINEMSENTLYVEGSVLARLLMGTVGLEKVRSNRVLTVIEKHPSDALFVNGAINAVNAARASGGLDASMVLLLDPAMQLIAEHSASGRAVGRVENLANLIGELRRNRDEFDAIAFVSIIKLPATTIHKLYFDSKGEMINPWGGVEAIFTHAVSGLLDVQTAHSPMMENQLISNMDVGEVDARLAAEAVSFTFMHSILKGLQRAPRIVTDRGAMARASVLTACDIACLIIPDGCLGLPTLGALLQGIPVVAVRGNKNIMRNDLTTLPWARGQFHIVENYFEAVGVMAAIKNGIAIDSIRRPLANVVVSENTLSTGEQGTKDLARARRQVGIN